MARRVKKKDHEKLDDVTIRHVISLLEREEDPITKKKACEILCISYNTKRLGNIIEQYKDRIEYEKKVRAKLRGKPLSEGEVKNIVIEYLKGDSVTAISKSAYRSTAIVKKCLEDNHIPLRASNVDYWHPAAIPDAAISKEFEPGELVWAARYNAVAEITSSKQEIFQIWVYGKHNEFAMQPWWELGKLEVLKRLNITADQLKRSDELNLNYG